MTLENFIAYCNDMKVENDRSFFDIINGAEPVTETFKESLDKFFETFVETLTRFIEMLKRWMYTVQQKMAKDKYLMVPKHFHEEMTKLERTVISLASAKSMSDKDVEMIQMTWNSLKSEIDELRADAKSKGEKYNNEVSIPLKEIYENLKDGSNLITKALKTAKNDRHRLKSLSSQEDINEAKGYLDGYKNDIKVYRILTEIDKYYLSFRTVKDKNANFNENPDNQVVTQEERDKGRNNK